MSFVVLLLTALLVTVKCAEIAHPPSSVNASLNSTVTFTCSGTGNMTVFRVDTVLASNPNITSRGFELEDEITGPNGTITRSLIAVASEANNNTVIICEISSSSGRFAVTSSPPAVLMIQGILDGVGDVMATVMDGGSNVLLTWTPPYSLDNVPITGYNIITSDGVDIIVNTTYHILTSSDPDPCNITTVSVGAINDVGNSQYNNVSFYYQTVPLQSDNIVSITNGSLDAITVVLDLSSLCVGERPNFVAINVIYSNNIVYNISMMLNDQLAIHHMITIQNDWVEYFIINVTLSYKGGETLYPFSLGHLGPVSNIESYSINCSITHVAWNWPPSVHNSVNIHNYTLRRYNDTRLVNSVTVNGSIFSYKFEEDNLFSHEYTYEICGNNELGEGDCNNGTFSYLRVPISVRDNTTLTQIDDNLISYNIPFENECLDKNPIGIHIIVRCNTIVYNVRDIDVRLESIDISDNITINETRHNLCQLSVTLTNVNLKSATYIKELQYYRRDRFYELLFDKLREIFFIFVGVGAACVLGYFLIIICIIILCICCYCCSSYYLHKNKSKKIELGESSITKDEQNGVSEDILPVITTNTEETQQASLCDDIPVLPGQVNNTTITEDTNSSGSTLAT